MKYCVLIIDGAAGRPLPQKEGKTSLELANTPNMDTLAKDALIGLARTVPPGMEPSSACACMSIIGYDPKIYYKGRSAIEAQSMGISIDPRETAFRCNLVTIKDGKMADYSGGHISTAEASELIKSVDENLGNNEVSFYPGMSYRHLLKIKNHEETVNAVCTPPHDIPEKKIAEYLPEGQGSDILRELMKRSTSILENHPINVQRVSRGESPANSIWLFWPSGQVPKLPSFKDVYGLKAAMISGVDLLKGLAGMAQMDVIDIAGVTDGPDNDYAAQAEGAIETLKSHDLVVVHVEAPDEAGHSGSVTQKVEAIERSDEEIVGRLLRYTDEELRVLIMPDHPTPIELRTHTPDPVPFMVWGHGIKSNGAERLTESEACGSGFRIENGYVIINRLINL
jgi:2,3-bisphosphoglycerate-independent phosphoglycerate mutase